MTADGQPACTPAPTLPLPTDQIDDSIALALVKLLGRRRFLQAAAGGTAALLAAACASAPAASPTAASTSAPAPAPTSAAATAPTSAPTAAATSAPAAAATTVSQPGTPTKSAATTASGAGGKAPWVYVFNTGSHDVTVIDSATNGVLATRPLSATIRWLSNEQNYWDGENIWSYDFPNNKLQAVVIDPKAMKVVKTIDTGTLGPGHSLMLTPDKKRAVVNAAGSNVINVIDTAAGQVTDKIDTGKFP
ncbi:MAG TPA: hypothetical protein VMW65_00555 [Chloroflexota bacterium]|nr:hypothetical protein [Chloroflexota bacterium]